MSALGKYRNRLGVELELTGIYLARNVIGTVYEGVIPDSLFGNRLMLVTAEGLTDCGYVKIEEEASEATAEGTCDCGHGQDVHFQDGCVDKSGGGYFCPCAEFEASK